jgi:hypothetical protein
MIRRILSRIPLFAMLLTGCTPAPPPKVSDLQFPVVVLYTNASTRVFKDATDLGQMNTQTVINSNSPPVLVDSAFNIFTLEKLQSIHGGLWLMAHPVGITEVTFDLQRAPKSGLDAARAAMQAQLETQTWRDDIDARSKKIATQTTLDGMRELLKTDDD